MIGTILLVFAFVFFTIGAFFGSGAPASPWYARFNLVCAGLAAWVLAELLGRGVLGR